MKAHAALYLRNVVDSIEGKLRTDKNALKRTEG